MISNCCGVLWSEPVRRQKFFQNVSSMYHCDSLVICNRLRLLSFMEVGRSKSAVIMLHEMYCCLCMICKMSQFLLEVFKKYSFCQYILKSCFQALYENLLVELPLAEFFLSKLVGRHSDVDVHHLASLDPIMYRNLLFLKSYEGDVTDLGLDFTVLNDELGETRVRILQHIVM